MKDAEGVFSERRKARASRGFRGHVPPENFENFGPKASSASAVRRELQGSSGGMFPRKILKILGLLECISRILGHE